MSDTPQRWWQWLLMYPTIVIALVAGVPQIYQWVSAVTIGLSPFGNVDDALMQQKAWERNVNCLHDIDHIKPSASTNYSIDLVSCPSGDILITLTPLWNPDRQISRWIVTNALFSEFAKSFLTIRALAQNPRPEPGGPTAVRIIDIKREGSTVVRRVQLSDNTCVDETIDTYTGRRLSQKPAPCTKF
jgi:hypothetical protein